MRRAAKGYHWSEGWSIRPVRAKSMGRFPPLSAFLGSAECLQSNSKATVFLLPKMTRCSGVSPCVASWSLGLAPFSSSNLMICNSSSASSVKLNNLNASKIGVNPLPFCLCMTRKTYSQRTERRTQEPKRRGRPPKKKSNIRERFGDSLHVAALADQGETEGDDDGDELAAQPAAPPPAPRRRGRPPKQRPNDDGDQRAAWPPAPPPAPRPRTT